MGDASDVVAQHFSNPFSRSSVYRPRFSRCSDHVLLLRVSAIRTWMHSKSVSSECRQQALLTNGNLTNRYVRPETGYRLGEELVLLGSVRWRSVR